MMLHAGSAHLLLIATSISSVAIILLCRWLLTLTFCLD